MKKILYSVLGISVLAFGTYQNSYAGFCEEFHTNNGIQGLCKKLVTKSEELSALFSNSTNQIHFIGGGENGNDFGGFFVMDSNNPNPALNEPITIKLDGGIELKCNNKVNGYYYSAARGNLFFPTNNTLLENLKKGESKEKYQNITIEGGFYSNCNDQYNTQKKHNTIVGHIQYKVKTNENYQNLFSLTAGRQYDLINNSMTSDNKLVGNLQLKDNTYPIGFFYDSDFGVSFLGGKITKGLKIETSSDMPESIKNTPGIQTLINNLNNYPSKIDILDEVKELTSDKIIFKDYKNSGDYTYTDTDGTTYTLHRGQPSEADTKRFIAAIKSIIGADGIVSFSEANTGDVIGNVIRSRKIIKNTETENDIVVTKSNVLNISDYINKARTNSEILCRGKWIEAQDGAIIDKDVCLNNKEGVKKLYIKSDLTQNSNPTNIVIKSNAKNPVSLIIESKQDGKGHLNVFLDNGILLFKNLQPNQLTRITSQGTIKEQNDGLSWYQGNMIRGNFAINGIMAGTDGNILTGINNRLFIDGTFGSLNTIGKPIQERKTLIENILGDDINYQLYISLTRIANNNGGVDTNGTYPGVLVWNCNTDSSNLSSDGTNCENDKKPSETVTESLAATPWYIRSNGNLDSFLTK